MTTQELEQEVRDLRRRMELAETRLSQVDGRFEFISGQLRDVQLYLHAKFGDLEKSVQQVEAEVVALRRDLPEIVGGAVRDAISPER